MKIKNIEGLTITQISEMVNDGGKFVIFPYTISIVIMTFKRASSIYFIPSGEGTLRHSYKHILTNGVLGWWGFPWGPIYTVGSLYHHMMGGKDVTYEIMNQLTQHDPQVNTSTYNINGIMSSNAQAQPQQKDTYNIPK
jgi:hypothetical protein